MLCTLCRWSLGWAWHAWWPRQHDGARPHDGAGHDGWRPDDDGTTHDGIALGPLTCSSCFQDKRMVEGSPGPSQQVRQQIIHGHPADDMVWDSAVAAANAQLAACACIMCTVLLAVYCTRTQLQMQVCATSIVLIIAW